MNKTARWRTPCARGQHAAGAGRRSKLAALALAAAVCLSIIFCTVSASGCSGETDSLNSVIHSGRLVFGIAPDMKPFSFVPSGNDGALYSGITDIQSVTPPDNIDISISETDTRGISGSDNISGIPSSGAVSVSDISGGDIVPADNAPEIAETVPPFSDTAVPDMSDDTEAQYMGLAVDLAKELTALLNVNAVFVPVEPERAYEALDNKEIDCYLYLAVVDIKTAATMNTIDTGLDYRQIFVVPQSGSISKLSELSGHSLGCVSNSDTAGALAQASLIRSEVSQTVYYSDVDAMLGAVESGDLDAAAVNEPIFNYTRRGRYEGLHKIDELLEENDMVIAMNLRDDTLSERIRLLYDMLKNDGTVERLEKKWLSAEPEQ